MAKRVLMTGHNGYIGSVMAPYFIRSGYDVIGLDTGYFKPCRLVPDQAEVPWVCKDLRDLELEDLNGFDAVVHLGALSNDPDRQPERSLDGGDQLSRIGAPGRTRQGSRR